MKTVRMVDLVERAGAPQVHLAWIAPTRDPVLKVAAARHRVLTIHQRIRGAKKDFGHVGLEPARDAQYLIFPKSLKRYAGYHVVGIQYGLLEEASGPVPARPAPARASRPSVKRGAKVVAFPAPMPRPSAVTREEKPATAASVHRLPPQAGARRKRIALPLAARRALQQALRAIERGRAAEAEELLRELVS